MFAFQTRWSILSTGVLLACGCALLFGTATHSWGKDKSHLHRMVVVPQEDRFTPFAITIRSGDTVEWVNMDTDDHTVVSDDFFNTAGHQGTNVLLQGTDSNGGQPGKFRLQFQRPGTFVYYCRFHAHLDHEHQPIAPGSKGGIQSDFTGEFGTVTGNYGTPMAGVITVLAEGENEKNEK